jgi:transposase
MRSTPEWPWRKTVPGMGDMLALTILLETGTIARFPSVGDLASSGRCVKRQRRSHGLVQGHGNTKHGHQYLGWAFVEAAHVAMRFDPGMKRVSQRQPGRSQRLVALTTVTHT